ncbi:AIG2-like family protein [Litoreibacter ascidiaceicola]|uniref:AIG2-like family protein n=1 Tax=Litoreibacter ascidiaceicola TaxID=1486859 RepID=A0A1M5EZL6_9RHOB|nr:gamma-glutamylcyclotransferase family protein [Litoreibacter ascidiaceicola]SHF84616.1 AIG2-like family protein [Litoreibacter ascidiaceicola]
MSFLYFAYGSNMLSSRLIARCPSARVISAAIADNHALKFSKKSNDGSGKATLVSQSTAIHTPGVLFEIDADEREELDKFEGAGKGYDRIDEFSITTSDETINATTYLASTTQNDLLPFDWYLALVIAGALEHKLGDDHHSLLRGIAHIVDEDVTRKTRTAALKALADHGHHDHITLL